MCFLVNETGLDEESLRRHMMLLCDENSPEILDKPFNENCSTSQTAISLINLFSDFETDIMSQDEYNRFQAHLILHPSDPLKGQSRANKDYINLFLLDNNDPCDDVKCSICTDLVDPVKSCKISCNHVFCRECIIPWLTEGSIRCPNCNQPAQPCVCYN